MHKLRTTKNLEHINCWVENQDKEFEEGPPCLAILRKERKKDQERDRFLHNYMVSTKKYPD